jgi:hydrogenase maturation protein HypF
VKNYFIQISGIIQGLGFRPFVYRLAHKLKISGWVENDGCGVNIFLENIEITLLDEFLRQLKSDKPSMAEIHSLVVKELSFGHQNSAKLVGMTSLAETINTVKVKKFEIKESVSSGDKFTRLIPDLLPCKDCLQELFDPSNRRYLYPFINCTNCGPRYSIIKDVPYDRSRTTMKKFKLCELCAVEYADPLNRRFHAEPIACANCGPKLQLWNQGSGNMSCQDPIKETVALLKQGFIVAIKGVGGFQLIADATNEEVVHKLRLRKNRLKKPFALMMFDISMVTQYCKTTAKEEELFSSIRGPIVLVRKKQITSLAAGVAPDNPYLGVFLPSSPLHYLILKLFGRPLIATSGNVSNEPICIRDDEAKNRLASIADYFLLHDREIVRPLDDSIVQIVNDKVMTIRIGRGYAPIYFDIPSIHLKSEMALLPTNASLDFNAKSQRLVMGLGAQLKNTVAFYNGKDIHLSQHFGDLDKEISQEYFDREIKKITDFYSCDENSIEYVGDLHPDYYTSRWIMAKEKNIMIQHHKAHLMAAASEFNLQQPYLGVVWDGTGYGEDNCIWGGEFFYNTPNGDVTRIGHLRPFRLLGGESTITHPWKTLFGICNELLDPSLLSQIRSIKKSWTEKEEELFLSILKKEINCPLTTSMGRLFDAIASLLVFSGKVEFEAQAAMALEFEAMVCKDPTVCSDIFFSWQFKEGQYILDWEPMLRKIVSFFADHQLEAGDSFALKSDIRSSLAFNFHCSLAKSIFDLVELVQVKEVVLSGGVFQNRVLLEEIFKLEKIKGIKVNLPQRVPVNDGGIALGQLLSGWREIVSFKAQKSQIE